MNPNPDALPPLRMAGAVLLDPKPEPPPPPDPKEVAEALERKRGVVAGALPVLASIELTQMLYHMDEPGDMPEDPHKGFNVNGFYSAASRFNLLCELRKNLNDCKGWRDWGKRA